MAETVSRNEARRALSSLGRRGKTTKFPGPIRDVVMAYVQEARSSGRRWGIPSSRLAFRRRSSSGGLERHPRDGRASNGCRSASFPRPTLRRRWSW